jgi:sugar phosphate isomerase/epimerase
MSTLSHGSDLRLAPTLAALTRSGDASPKKAFVDLAASGFRAVQLDATLAGLRPRELDRTARRDLQAAVKRSGLIIAGLDFFIPAEHYVDVQHVDRAVDAALASITLSADLGRVPLSLNLPVASADGSILRTLTDAAESCGVPLAIHDEGDLLTLIEALIDNGPTLAGIGLDPAAVLIRDRDPVSAAQQLGSALRVARLSDASKGRADSGRQTPGTGSLSLMAYRVSVDLAPNRLGPVVLDLRGLTSPVHAMLQATTAWDNSALQL